MNRTKKQCRECRKVKQNKSFSHANNAPDGLRLDCIKCVNKLEKANIAIPNNTPQDIDYPIMTERFLLGNYYDEFLRKIEQFGLIKPI